MFRIVSNFFLVISIILLNINTSQAEYCIELGKRCIDDENPKIINGLKIHKACWEYEFLKECYKDAYIDSCIAISATSGCQKISSDCIKNSEDNSCAEIKEQYQCGNLLEKAADLTYLDTSYTITKDRLNTSECDLFKLDSECQQTTNKCLEGAEERVINGKKIHKNCWKYQQEYSCFRGSVISECDALKTKCQHLSNKCISFDKDGICRHKENSYKCSNVSKQNDKVKHCTKAKYCIGADCKELKYESNNNMGLAVSGLATLSGLKKEINQLNCSTGAENCNVFKGKRNSCIINPMSARNCCKDSGWLKDAKLVGCEEDEKLLAEKKKRGVCHYVGSYCSKQIGVCLEKKQTYCCFDTKLAKTIHEQGRSQLGIGWGDPKNPNCSALTVEQLQKINFERIDFKDVYSEVLNTLNSKKHDGLQQQVIKQAEDKSIESKYNEQLNKRIRGYYEK